VESSGFLSDLTQISNTWIYATLVFLDAFDLMPEESFSWESGAPLSSRPRTKQQPVSDSR